MDGVTDSYKERLEKRRGAVAAQERLHIRAGNWKLLAVAAGIATLWIALASHKFSPDWLAVPACAFAALFVWHERILRARSCAQAAVTFYERGLARIEDRWAGRGPTGERFRSAKHLYSEDLDLFGRGGLFELLSIARTPMGEQRLADWLLVPSTLDSIHERHVLLAELRANLDLREDIAVQSENLRGALDPQKLVSWAAAAGDPLLGNSILRWMAAAMSLAFVAATIALFASGTPFPLVGVLAVESGVLVWLWRRAQRIIESAGADAEGLILFSGILQRIENENFTSPRLCELRASLGTGPSRASLAIRRLARITYWIDGREGLAARLAELPLLYTVQVGFAAEAWRKRWGSWVSAWVDTTAEIEALLSLANYAYEHPADPFPEIDAGAEGPCGGSNEPQPFFDGEGVGHPLIPLARCVRNDVRLECAQERKPRVLVVSGSNMSGKSTLLRAVGLNTVLGMAGAPVRCVRLRMTPLAVGTSIRRTDSLQEGRSGFYTEILRLRDVFALSNGELPLLFLLDELLEGTNSHDRCVGAKGLLRALAGRRTIGMVTTHDLALAEIAVELGQAFRNVHLEDQIVGGEMRFDYKLRDGVVTKSNALELMRGLGLEV